MYRVHANVRSSPDALQVRMRMPAVTADCSSRAAGRPAGQLCKLSNVARGHDPPYPRTHVLPRAELMHTIPPTAL